jgi:hypothetical protein
MNELKNLFSVAAAVVAAIPGLGLLTANLEILPGVSRILYGGVLEALSLMTFLIIWLNKSKIEALKPSQAVKRALWCLFIFLLILIVYIYLLQSQIRDKIVFPLFPIGDLKKAISTYGSIDSVISNYHLEGTEKLIVTSNSTLILTKIIFLILFQVPMILLVIAFGIVGINLRNQ